MSGEVFVDLCDRPRLYHVREGAAQVSQCPRRGGDHDRGRVAFAHQAVQRFGHALCEPVLLDFMPVRRLHGAAPRRAGAGEGAAGPVGPLLMGGRIVVDEHLLGDEIRELLVAFVTKEKRLAAVADENVRVVRNEGFAHLKAPEGEADRAEWRTGFACELANASRRSRLCACANCCAACPTVLRYASVIACLLTKESLPMTTPPISRFAPPALADLPKDVRERIEAVQEKSGFAPNVFLALARRPDEFRAFFAYHDALMEKPGGLTKAEREMIVVATSAVNNCHYCVVAHGAILRIRAKNPLIADQVAVNFRKADLTARQKAMLDFAMKVAARSHEIDERDYAALRAQNFSGDDAWDIAAIAALFAMSKRLANAFSIRPNDEFYNMGREPRG